MKKNVLNTDLTGKVAVVTCFIEKYNCLNAFNEGLIIQSLSYFRLSIAARLYAISHPTFSLIISTSSG